MADDSPRDAGDQGPPPKTPFDNPFFLPVLLWVFAVWFGYDGWFNPEMEWIRFNRYGFAVVVTLALWFTWRAVKERRAERERGETQPPA
jgi:hypothetical protein